MNGASSDNGVSIQKMVTSNMVGRNLVTPNMVAWNLDILEHDHSEVTWNLVTPTWLYSTLVIATL